MMEQRDRKTSGKNRARRKWAAGIAALLAGGTALGLAGFGAIAAYTPTMNHAARAPVRPRPARPAPVPAAPPAAPAAADPAQAAFVVKRILPIDGPLRLGDYYWDEAGVPAGQVVITVDLAAQTLSIFRAGYEIGAAAVIFGADQTPTPLGVFPITEKDAHHVSNLYDAPMPYMLRLTNDGISIHGSPVGNGYVTHGCIGVPVAFAKKLFEAVRLGDKVILTRGETLGLGDAIKAA
ncbi:MAG: L,D-transpeptidase family protein [Pseudomonadota bacterium]